jgi:predicted regulator of Ras-like GTPase activity (Roadblock/LC7/MglB family)
MDSYGGMVSTEDSNPPRLFINWSVVQQLLQANTDGAIVQHTLLLKLDGSLLTSSYETAETKAAYAAAAAAAAAAATPAAASAVPAASASSSAAGSSAAAASPASSSSPPQVLPKILGALVANIWKGAESGGQACLQSQALGVMLVECERGVVAVSRLARFLLCIYATNDIPRGALRQKMNDLLTQLQPLHRVYAN